MLYGGLIIKGVVLVVPGHEEVERVDGRDGII